MGSGSAVDGWSATTSWYQWSRSRSQSMAPPVRRTTTQWRTPGQPSSAVVGVGLERHRLGRPPALVLGDDDGGLEVDDAIAQRVGREAAEDHGVPGPDAGAGQHGHRQLGDHAHVDGHPVALAHAEPAQPVGQAAHALVQVAVGDGLRVAGLALPVVGDAIGPGGQVAVEAVDAHVEPAADEPPEERRVAAVADRVPGLDPLQLGRLLGPEPLEVGGGAVVELPGRDRPGRELRRRREDPILDLQGLDGVRAVAHVPGPPCVRAVPGPHRTRGPRAG